MYNRKQLRTVAECMESGAREPVFESQMFLPSCGALSNDLTSTLLYSTGGCSEN